MTHREYEKEIDRAHTRSAWYKKRIFGRMMREGRDELVCQHLLNDELLEITQRYYAPDNLDRSMIERSPSNK
jgi:hypothetical protein